MCRFSDNIKYAKMNTVRSSAWIIVLNLAFIINFCKVYCSQTTLKKQTIVENEMHEKTSKNLLASLGLHQDPITTEVKAMKMTDVDFNNETTSGNTYRTLHLERSREHSAVHDIPVHDVYELNGTDAILNLDNNVRRSARQVEESQRCQRLPLNIKFEDIQMTWVHSPREYNAYYCAGECNHPLVGNNVTNHAKFQSINHFYNPDAGRDPCCVPTELSDLEIIHFVGRIETRTTMKDMVVEKCGCR